MLLQEVLRRGDAVPAVLPQGVTAPGRIGPRSLGADVAAFARDAGLFLAYVPSMRNGDDAVSREDRGSAILSSEPLRDLTAIELPFGKQRRVAVMATVLPRGGKLPSFRAIAGHLDTPSANLDQAEALASFLKPVSASGLPIVLGIDTNATWGGTDPSVAALDRVLPREEACGRGPTSRWFARVDFFFTNLPSSVTHRCETIGDSFGSDHRPVVLTIE